MKDEIKCGLLAAKGLRQKSSAARIQYAYCAKIEPYSERTSYELE